MRKRRVFRTVAVLLAIIASCGGLVLWHLSRPRYLVHVTGPVGREHAAIAFAYPSDWYVDDGHIGQQDRFHNRGITWLYLRRAPRRGPQQWIDEHLYRITDQDWYTSDIVIGLQQAASFKSLDAEAKILERSLQTNRRGGGIDSICKSICPAGPMLDMQVHSNSTTNSDFRRSVLIYPAAAAGGLQYEVFVNVRTTERLKLRLRQVADDVVSRIKLVKEQGRRSP